MTSADACCSTTLHGVAYHVCMAFQQVLPR